MDVSINIDSTNLDETARAFKALADPTRLRVLEVLSRGEHCVCEIQRHFEALPQNLLSHHLRVLKDAGLVRSEKRGRWVHYRLDEDQLAALRAAVPQLRGGKEDACGCRVAPSGAAAAGPGGAA
ncbi:metalloregulator ArsR/SmtB family transcription factor [Oceanithermus sp.]|uniref:ArsR/SmtB family transcription factor n=1 Tax=Oceanithermus sp. TaxID=2268145 RepID=UPI0025EE0607|nr:metalloregulator ArsR/SmtB family transcription factor [Oceanithermus sp.]